MAPSRPNEDAGGTGGKPVGRAATDRLRAARRSAAPPSRPLFTAALPMVILALVVGLGGGVAIGYFISNGNQQAAATSSTAAGTTFTTAGGTGTITDDALAYGVVTVSGAALPVLTSGQADTALGLAIPEIEGMDFAGNPQSITANGKGKLIVGLAHWCPYCQQELPVLTEWYASAGLANEIEVFVVTVFTDPERGNFPPGTWLAAESWDGAVLADDEAGSLAAALGIASVPYNLLVTPEGTVAARVTGGLSAAQLDSAVGYLLGSSTTTTTP